MKCPKCNSENHVKDGIVKGKQRYYCKECKYRYTVDYRGKPLEIKRMALHLYLEGLGFRSIGRLMKVSNVTVLKWIKAFGQEIERAQKEEKQIEIVELDELHTYIKSKKTIVGYGWLLIGMGEDTLTSCLVPVERKLEAYSGIK